MKRLIFIGILPILPLYAGVTGKIAGRVVNSKTGEPLPAVNVIIEGTGMGAATDANGDYYIINIPVGTYSVTASMIGYEPITKTQVKVSADFTTIVNFSLKPTTIKVPGVTITAERPMVTRDATATVHVVTGETIDRQPVANFQQVVAQQAGVVSSAGGASGATGGLHLRGGRADEVSYIVDGMSIKDPITGQAGADIINLAIVEMTVITGGFNAEYGQAMSGLVNVVTKEGREFSGLTRYRTDQIFTGPLNEGENRIEASIGGPFPLYKKLLYYLSGDILLRDHTQGYDFAMSNTFRERYATQGKLTYKLTPSMKFNLSGFLTRNQQGLYGVFVGLPGLDQRSENDWKYAPPEYRNVRFRKAYQLTSSFTHQLSKETFYDLRFGYFNTHTIVGHPDIEYEKRRRWWEDIKFRPWWLDVTADYKEPPVKGWDAKDERGEYYYPYGVPGIFRLGSAGYWEERESDYYGLNFDITSQVTPNHQLKFGMSGKRYHINREQGQYIYTIKTEKLTDTTFSVVTVEYDTIEISVPEGDTIEWIPPKDSIINNDTLAFWDIRDALYFDVYDEHPIEAALYLQDKIEYESFIINLGLRLDYLDPRTWKFRDILSPYDTLGNLDTVSVSPKYQVSPRLGVSFPVTDQTVFHVAYGHFFQMPRLRWLYDGYNNPIQRRRGAWGLVGNPDLKAQRTIEYEIGVVHEFIPNLALSVTAFYKDIYNLINARFIPAIPDPYTAYQTEDYGNCKGLEFVLKRRATQYLSGQIAYTLQFAQGTSSYEREAYYDYIANIPVDPYTGEPFELPKIDYPLEFDQRHTIVGNLDLLLPSTLPEPLRDIDLNILTQIGSGLPYTKRDNRNYIVGVTNACRMPWTWTVDLKFQKIIDVRGLKFSLFCEITNLFNTRNILKLYPNTGRTDDNEWLMDKRTYLDQTWPSAYKDQDRIPVYKPEGEHNIRAADERRDLDKDGYITKDEWYQSYENAYKDYMNDPYFFGSPRHISIGISFNW